MDRAIAIRTELSEQQYRDIEKVISDNEAKLFNFIRKSVTDAEAEDIVQDVFYQLTESYQMMKPIENVSAWMFRVAKNKVTDLFRKKKPDYVDMREKTDEENSRFLSIINNTYANPDDEMLHQFLIEEIESAIGKLPQLQQEVFIAHEIEGLSFKEISEKTGSSVNTLLSRKRYAVLALRESLQEAYKELFD